MDFGEVKNHNDNATLPLSSELAGKMASDGQVKVICIVLQLYKILDQSGKHKATVATLKNPKLQ